MPYNDQESFVLRDAGFNVPSPEEQEQMEIQQQEQLRQAQQAEIERQQQETTPRSIATEKDADGNYVVQEQEREKGFWSQLGEITDDVLSGRYRQDQLHEFAPDIFKKDSEQIERERVERFERVKEEGNFLEKGLVYTAAGIEVTADAATDLTVNLPATLGAVLTDQEAEWLNPPAIVDKDPLGEEAYKLVQVVAPSVAVGAKIGRAHV